VSATGSSAPDGRGAVLPHRIRRRLTVAFVLVAAVAAGSIAMGTYLRVHESRIELFRERSVSTSELSLEFILPNMDVDRVGELLELYQSRGGFQTVIVMPDGTVESQTPFALTDVPQGVRLEPGEDGATEGTAHVDGDPFLVIGRRASASPLEVYFFFPKGPLLDGLDELRDVLVVGWVAVTVLAALIGNVIARRTLRPVREASDAARQLAEGLLDTRLPVGGADEFGAWAEYFNDMADALEAKITALSQAHERERRFTADVAHELRTPLTAIVASASMIGELRNDVPDAVRPAIDHLVDGARRLRDLVNELLELSRLDAGVERAEPEAVVVSSLVDGVTTACGWTGIENRCDPGDVITTDRRRLQHIVMNLLANAVHHGRPPVVVTLQVSGDDATIVVTDHGTGIPDDVLPHVFERFFKADPHHSWSGSGLGLAIVTENARILGGTIMVCNEPGAGACFTLHLPDVRWNADDSAPVGAKAARAASRP
jgi:signal transduction histidine kinase